MGKLTEYDREFLRSFDECSLGKACWSHAAHVRMAWLKLEICDNFQTALEEIKTSIQRFNAVIGTIGYHETVTVAFTRLIHYRRLLGDPNWNYEEFIKTNADLVSKTPSVLDRYYESGNLTTSEARASFVAPSKRPLPASGIIRAARPEDTERMLHIYSPFVENTAVSFETEPPSAESFSARVAEYSESYPWLVFEGENGVIGYAYGSKHRSRAAYQWATEVSVYVAPEFQRAGVGRALYSHLLRALTEMGYRLALGGIALPNESSVTLHESMGFEPVGVYRNIGFKLGKWHDVGWWQKTLGENSKAPPTAWLTTRES